MYTLTADYSEPYTDGSGRFKLIAKKGQAVAWATARAWGLVDGEEPEKVVVKPKKEETQT